MKESHRYHPTSPATSVIAQNDTLLPVTTFPWFRHMSTLPWWHFMKVIEKTPKLEDWYLELCNSVWPQLYTVGNIFLFAKTFQKTPKSEHAQKYPKNEFFDVYASFLKETHVHTRLAIYNTRVHLKYVTFCIDTRVYLLTYETVVSATRVCLLKMSNKIRILKFR